MGFDWKYFHLHVTVFLEDTTVPRIGTDFKLHNWHVNDTSMRSPEELNSNHPSAADGGVMKMHSCTVFLSVQTQPWTRTIKLKPQLGASKMAQ